MKQGRLIGPFVILLILLLPVAVILWLLSSSDTSSESSEFIQPGTIDAHTTFTSLLLPELPASVINLQGEAETLRGYSAYLRFEADPSTIEQIISSGFQPCSFEQQAMSTSAQQVMTVDLHSAPSFDPAWNPESIVNPECYEAEVKNDWTDSGHHWLVVDRPNGVVYFVGNGG